MGILSGSSVEVNKFFNSGGRTSADGVWRQLGIGWESCQVPPVGVNEFFNSGGRTHVLYTGQIDPPFIGSTISK